METAIIKSALLAALVASFVADTALAHHSYAMFDASRTIIIQGTVKRWELINPHSFLFITVIDEGGHEQEWGMEAPGPNILLRAGWTRKTANPGEKVTVELNPLRDGRTGGNLRKITLPDGRFLCTPPLGKLSFEAAQVSPCAGTQGGPELISAPGDAREQGNKREVAPPGSVPAGPKK